MSSDDELEGLPKSVTNYYFVDDNEDPISFSNLSINWDSGQATQGSERQIYIRGNAGGGLETIFKPVKAWKFDISTVKPEISVLSKDNNWIKLLKPRQSYDEQIIRSVLITVNFLHVVKRNPELHGKRIWKKLSNIFSLYEETPSSRDLIRNRALIEQAVKHDESLKNSKYLLTVLERNSLKKHRADEDVLVKGKKEFVVSDDDCSSDDLEDDSGDEEDGSANEDGSADEEDDEDEPFDSVCSICDEGGPLLCCEGSCMRSFHATRRAGKPSKCISLGFTEKEVQDMPYFKCQNCQYKLHQCFSCGQLGSSDKEASAEVFQCVNATCGYFYHPHCVANRLHEKDTDDAKDLAEKIRGGESFSCPLHICIQCKKAEDKTEPNLQMAVCRRCPKAYHKKCLPRKIALEEDEDKGIEQRAWEGLLVDRILIYCLKHKIIDDLGTPSRDHIKFRDSKKEKESSAGVWKENKVELKQKMPSSRAPSPALPALDAKKKIVEDSDLDKKNDRTVPKLQKNNSSRKLSSEKKPFVSNADASFGVEERKCLKPCPTEKLGEVEANKTTKAAVKKIVHKLDSDSERRILDLMNEASSIISLDDIIAKHDKLISFDSYKQKMDPCKSITLGKVNKSCEAVRAAVKKLDEGIEGAKNICEPDILNQLDKWKGKLRVYLAPFLYGMRYTSFGRHFTKPDKLKEIVDILHWYVNDDDTIVDFCCGANDFSWFMKQKLENSGKKCNYKNYDLFRPKNDFCFETRDWMKVKTNELPTGSKLIMGINPPFGVKASKANQFIDKALEFKPKLIILIVPPETERLDKKKTAYDLVWEDKDKLSGKSFYLPGSVDINDKQMEDWNVVAPVLYLWSRPDWTASHMEIAKKHHHLLGEQRENSPPNKLDRDPPFKNRGHSSIATEIASACQQTHSSERLKERAVGENDDLEKQSAPKDLSMEKLAKAAPQNSKSKKKKNEKKKRYSDVIHVSGGPHKRRRSSPDRPHHEVPHHTPDTRDRREPHKFRHHPNVEPIHHEERRLSVENRPSMYYRSPPNLEVGDAVNEYDHPRSLNYGAGNYSNLHHQDSVATYHPPGDMHPSPHHGYPPSDPTMGFVRPDTRGYGSVEQRYGVQAYRTTESSLYNERSLNHMSATDKYNIGLDQASLRGGGFGLGHGHGPLDRLRLDEPSFHPHHHAPRQEFPSVPMGFAPAPANPYLPHSSSGGWIHD